jgi:hypothetical protein
MNKELKPDTWIYVIVQDPGAEEQFLGQYDSENDISFIPAFFQKEDAQECFLQFARKKGKKYEIQAISYDDLTQNAAENGFLIFMLDAEGNIQKKNNP